MQFAGSKIIDILQTVAQCKIPLSTPIKLCAMCASTLLSTLGVIEKVVHMVSNLMGTNLQQTVENQKEADLPNSEPEVVEVEELQVEPSNAKASPKKSAPIINGTPTAAKEKALSSPTKQLKNIKDQGTPNVPSGETPKKQPTELQSSFKVNLDDSLKDVIKLTPAKEVPKKHKDLTLLFGNSVNNIPDSEDGSDDDDDIPDHPEDKDVGFECKLCDYKTTLAAKFKHHLRDNHGQKRPRILNCSVCPKSFGVLKTLNKHLVTHGIVPKQGDVDAKKEHSKSGDAQLAVLTALKPTSKPKPILNAELTFAIKDTNSSTPKPNEEQQQPQEAQPIYKCDMCETQTKVPKYLQEHMKTVHNIEKPKIFKCGSCSTTFMHKITRDRHFLKKHCGDQGQDKATKTPARRKTIDVRPTVTIKVAKPAKSPIRRKTVDVRILESPLAKQKSDLKEIEGTPNKNVNNEVAHTPNQLQDSMKATDSPSKKKLKESPKDDVASILKEVFKASESPVKKKSKKGDADITSIQLDDRALEGSVAGTPKKSKSKKGSDMLDNPQVTPIEKKSNKRKSESELQSDVVPSPLKKSKLEKKKKSECEVIELLDEVNMNPMPHKREMLESQSESQPEAQFSCSQCSKVVSTRKRLDSHIRKKHTPLLNCRKCEENFTDTEKFITHFESCESSNGLACGVKSCDKIFAAANFLSSHLKKKHKFG
ncbi:hypothetical protein ACLKA7_016751 [Drosophila subpalustris]